MESRESRRTCTDFIYATIERSNALIEACDSTAVSRDALCIGNDLLIRFTKLGIKMVVRLLELGVEVIVRFHDFCIKVAEILLHRIGSALECETHAQRFSALHGT